MHSGYRGQIEAVLDRLDDATDELCELNFDALNTPERLWMLERLERVARRLPVPGHALINGLARQATSIELGGRLGHALADRLRITRAEANRRIHDAADLGTRQDLTGQPLEPVRAATAAAQRDGAIGADHIRAIRRFCDTLPSFVDQPTADRAEAELARHARDYRPEEITALAQVIADCLNPDGRYNDTDRARRRSLTLGPQGPDGMSKLSGCLDPQLRAALEAVLAKLAAPGMANPEHPDPAVDGTPSQEAIDKDTRSSAQRNHDGLLAALRALLASGRLGQHNGLPVSVIVTTTLGELEAGAGQGLTAGGTLLPMSDVVRLASHAHRYLAIFDHGKPLVLHHTKRLANKAQRLVLYAAERGCSHPGCTVGAYYCEVHHTDEYADCRRTHIDELTLACPGSHHPLVGPGGWQTRKNRHNITEWLPPPHLDRGQPRTNTFHHPEKLLRTDRDDDAGP